MPLIRITIEQLKKKLEQGEISFKFKKLDGSERDARGTTSPNHIPVQHRPRENSKQTGGTPYFDLMKNEWRSVTIVEDIFLDTNCLSQIYGTPLLDDEEIYYMLNENELLEDEWMSTLINLIKTANPENSNSLAQGFKKLVRVIKMYEEDRTYSESLKEKFRKFYYE